MSEHQKHFEKDSVPEVKSHEQGETVYTTDLKGNKVEISGESENYIGKIPMITPGVNQDFHEIALTRKPISGEEIILNKFPLPRYSAIIDNKGNVYKIPLIRSDIDSLILDLSNKEGKFEHKGVWNPLRFLSSKHLEIDEYPVVLFTIVKKKELDFEKAMQKVKIILNNQKKAKKLRMKKLRNK